MKNLLIYSLAAMIGLLLTEGKAYAWFGNTHKDILEKSLKLLEGQKNKEYFSFFLKYRDDLLDRCTEPDNKGDIDKGSGMHYYCAANKRGKPLENTEGYYKNRLGKYNRSARTMLEENYTMALSLFKSGKQKQAMHMLGRAIHFIQDIGCTVHSSGIRYGSRAKNPHYAFEKYAQNNFSAIPAADSLDKRAQKAYATALEKAANKLAEYSSSYTADVRSLDKNIYAKILKSTHSATQQYPAFLLIRFYNDINNNSDDYLVSGHKYCFKNLKTSGALTAASKKLILDEQTNSPKQVFTIKLCSDGSFMLIASNNKYVKGNCKGYINDPGTKRPIAFRAAALGNRTFRITTQASKFKKVLSSNKNGVLVIKRFSPNDKGAVWIIKKER